MVRLKNEEEIFEHDSLIQSFLRNKESNCILYSKEGVKFNVHKEILLQSKLMQNLLLNSCSECNTIFEIFCPCSEQDLESILSFLYDGSISFNKEANASNIMRNLTKIFGFPENNIYVEDYSKLSYTNIIENEEKFEIVFDDEFCDDLNESVGNTTNSDLSADKNADIDN